MFGRLLGWYAIYTFSGLLTPNGILPGAKLTLRPSPAFSYIGNVTARATALEQWQGGHHVAHILVFRPAK